MEGIRLFLVSSTMLVPVSLLAEPPGGNVIERQMGVVLTEGESAEAGIDAVSCSLTIFPDVVVNGEEFEFLVDYTPSMSGSWVERFIFNWPSTFANFDEQTIRTKTLKEFSGVGASSEHTVAPIAEFIAGTFMAKVEVSSTGGVIVCRASASMTVVNP